MNTLPNALCFAAGACFSAATSPQNKKRFRTKMRNQRCGGVCPGDEGGLNQQKTRPAARSETTCPTTPHVRYCQRAKPAGCWPPADRGRHCAPRPALHQTACVNNDQKNMACCKFHRGWSPTATGHNSTCTRPSDAAHSDPASQVACHNDAHLQKKNPANYSRI